jgi:hypothetical protein
VLSLQRGKYPDLHKLLLGMEASILDFVRIHGFDWSQETTGSFLQVLNTSVARSYRVYTIGQLPPKKVIFTVLLTTV